MATSDDVSALDPSRPWEVVLTSSDFGADAPVDECFSATPSERRAAHYWVRDFSSGAGDTPTVASQGLEIAKTPEIAGATYDGLIGSLATCRDTNRHISDYKVLGGLGDEADLFSMQYVDGGVVRDEYVVVTRTGTAISTWVVKAPASHPVRTRSLIKVAGAEVEAVCTDAEGACTSTPYTTDEQTPPADERAPGFLAAVDLPLFAAVPEPWVATTPKKVTKNPSLTDCDQANFRGAGADDVQARAYVIPSAPQVGPLFGMSETMGTFASDDAARQFVTQVTRFVGRCEDRQLNATVQQDDDLHLGSANGHVWQFDVAASETNILTFRVCLMRVGSTVAQVTFTPSDTFDVDHADYIDLAQLAAARLQQL